MMVAKGKSSVPLTRKLSAKVPSKAAKSVSSAKQANSRNLGKSAKPTVGEFLFEIGCEEIPAGMIEAAAANLQASLQKYFEAENIHAGAEVKAFGAPRRLTATCAKVRLLQPEIRREVNGPPKAVAFDAAGQPTRAAESFAAKQGVPVSALRIVNTPRGEYLVADQVIPGRPSAEILAELLPRVIAEIPWPKTMYWTGATGLRFIRPVRWVLAILGGKALRFVVADVESGAETRGHRFLGKPSIPVRDFAGYVASLRKNNVLALPEERKKKVEKELSALTSRKGLSVNPDAGLSNLVTYLNECPSVILGDFDPAYLELPEEILITVMRGHQKYFAVRKRDGQLAPHFLAVINLPGDRKGLVRAGHERVLRARFADARFFCETDQKGRLADNISKLSQVTFQVKLGSYGDKVERVRALARWIAEQLFSRGTQQASVGDCDRAAELAKCDLVTDMVREFTELQGIVGGLYAKVQGEPEEISAAVYDHYRPVGLSDPIPRNLTGCIVAIADKLDTLAGCFAVGQMPTGSSDPYALRRAALGVAKIILERKLPLSLSETVAAAMHGFVVHAPRLHVRPESEKQLLDFLLDRVRYILQERDGYANDEVSAVLTAANDNLVDVEERVRALKAIRKTRNFEPLAVSFKRIRKIIEKAGPEAGWILPGVRPELFEDDVERTLHTSAHRVARQVEQQKNSGRYHEALQEISTLRPDVDEFFARVMVMADNEEVRKNRLTLLAQLLKEFSTIADFSELGAAVG